MKKAVTSLGLIIGLASGGAFAQQLDERDFYIGGGINVNSLSGADDSTGYQLFAGYKMPWLDVDPFNVAVELGYLDTGDFDFDVGGDESFSGIWANALVGYPVSRDVQFFGRAGFDFGDDDGLMFGVGAGYALTSQLELRGEYVVRDNTNSVQANVAFHF
ncbi:hypothetical protein CAI21_10475 [Alkalilimnicola ehrlichii]|uniref:Outer membrane protein beta-barrel domain-containing protein n=1 Tax=Alkalilimnicola ehrlichii TaxID=351052 RepID=A0A3E0WVS1_9GAMM|nr:outer membrane beta-barrel protein [Alkalilimnicola ehrlichii]RFA29185.1 hypothetical protein CAI21_10475 [Alkalilimnicola ehrlichii]RFA36096.1 hypothetical protein CAL65_11615 [Alkalilimnicola ehrlichii]